MEWCKGWMKFHLCYYLKDNILRGGGNINNETLKQQPGFSVMSTVVSRHKTENRGGRNDE